MKKAIQHFLAGLTLLACLEGRAQTVPALINYQGQLLDAGGNPMPTGDYTIEVRLFPVDSGGAVLWGPQIFNGQSGTGLGPRVPVVQGRFNIVLGPQDTGGRDLTGVISSNQSAFLELKVGTSNPIVPRQQILSAPFALKAANAANSVQLAGFGWESAFPDTGRPDTGHIPESRIADGAITTSKIAANAVGTLQVTNGAITPAKLNLQAGNVAIGQATATYLLDVRSTNGAAIHAANSFGPQVWLAENGDAMYANGTVIVQGNLVKTTGSFRIDHPLDPANKYLYHSFVESPEMKNIYDGLVALDDDGEALVELPDWFEPLNQDFRYQLTAIGAPGPNLYVATEITQNRFKISGGAKGLKVSWQVTGVRHDAYANAHRIQVEEDKPAAQRGYYLHPEEQGQPKEKTALSVRHNQTESSPK